ncbi:hypothetical protein FNF27_04810 [Cafeteria roenbergensis]|uniref:DNA mismatch repair protein S5 domain-containing protein n=1 Tax=Cafeteria roenbergensis TaxID=33653 RepID=A0A5A8ECL7_CAFRO|nr:hypothetical protein FNF27_04810 [Cafeteria roenbergensis]
MAVRRLRHDVVDSLRSGAVIATLAQALEELVLNSADAQATCVDCSLFPSEASVVVSDNGTGMSLAELSTIGERHVSSKGGGIAGVHGMAMGFRGEALASLAALSHLEVSTHDRSTGKTWTRILQRPAVDETVEADRPRVAGTAVAVRQLFAAMPVRRARLVPSSELAAAVRVLQRMALALPHVSTSLRCDGALRATFRACSSRRRAIAQQYGEETASRLRRVQARSACGGFLVSGYVGLARSSNDAQLVFVNARYCKRVPRLVSAMRRATDSFLGRPGPLGTRAVLPAPRGRLPAIRGASGAAPGSRLRQDDAGVPVAVGPDRACIVAVLDVECDPSRYDVGFDPEKTVIEFDDWEAVTGAIEASIDAYFLGGGDDRLGWCRRISGSAGAPAAAGTPGLADAVRDRLGAQGRTAASLGPDRLRPEVEVGFLRLPGIGNGAAPPLGDCHDSLSLRRKGGVRVASADGSSVSREQLRSARVIGQLDDKFVLAVAPTQYASAATTATGLHGCPVSLPKRCRSQWCWL